MNWQLRALAREAVLNLRSNATRTAVLAGITAAALGTLAFLELRQAADIRAFAREYDAAGGYVVVVTPAEGATLSAGRCAAIESQEGVIAAGPVRLIGVESFTSAPGVLFQSAVVGEGTLRVWTPGTQSAPSPPGESLAVGVALAKELGLRAGSYIAAAGGMPAAVSAVIDSRRNPQIQRWALDVAPPDGTADACWVAFRRASYAAGQTGLPAWFASGSREPLVRPYLRSDQFTRDPAQEFAGRPQRFGWLAAAGLIVALAVLAAWFRRSEIGLYLAVGTSRAQLLGLLAIETLVVTAIAFLASTLWAVAIRRALHQAVPADELRVALRSAGSGALLALLAAPFAQVLVARGNIAALLKDR